ncbi:molybdopterin-dependent oxidoreductase [Thioalkalicoccus limnaeus]|uniref:Molybdopterin-dependent oxidoreductase n=1 Tax=Thioalkalicoccus limnaeus TaxID=120681 RepID=A0ABV4BG59_9GAMM
MSREALTTCPLCEACCGLRLTVEGGRVTRIRGDREDPMSRGFLCPKGAALAEFQEDPNRLRTPVQRTATGWQPLAWDAALDLAARRLRAVQDDHGRDAVALYRGNPNAHNLGLLLYGAGLVRTLGTRNLYSPTSMDQLPNMLVALRLYGHQVLMPVPDLDRTGYLLMLGANPAVSNGSVMTAPGVMQRLRAIQERGGRIVVVDPRRTETARIADRHLFIRPGRDPLLLAAMLHRIFAQGLERPGRLGAFTDGLDRVRAAVVPFSPQRVAATIGIPAATIEALVEELLAAEAAIVYGRLGTCVQAHGTTTQWLIQLLNLVTGHLDRPGGMLFTSPLIDPLGRLRLAGAGTLGQWTSRVRGLPEFCGELPVAALIDELETPGPGQIRALLTIAGNPVLAMPGGPRLAEALERLDFMVSVDPYINETTRHADLILPPVSPFEREHFDLVFNFLAIRNVAKWSPPVLTPPAGALTDWQILAGLHQRLARSPVERAVAALLRRLGPERLVALGLRVEALGRRAHRDGPLTMRRLQAHPHGLDLGPLESRLPERLRTPNGRIQAAPPDFVAALERLAIEPERPTNPEFALELIGRRDLRSNNSWMHNLPRLMTGAERCTLLVNPDDARRYSLTDGMRARLRSKSGALEVPIRVSDAMMPGVVSLPHGWGHDLEGAALTVAGARPGVNVNGLIDPNWVDPVSGTSVLNGTPVTLEPIDA